MDIRFDLAQVRARIAQITGVASFAPAPAPAATFASVVHSVFPPPMPQAPLQWPVTGEVTSPFGERKNPLGPGDDFHPGIDIAAQEGTPIVAAVSGRVVAAGPDGGYGNALLIDDGNGVTTRYAHCSRVFPRIGDFVRAGETIGAVGSTGRSTGPHLHFEVRIDDRPVDPTQFLPS